MALTSGTRLGPYEVVALLGAGGMGEVYRAKDTNLGRDVALKTLPDSVTHDPERLARFRREAQVLAALNHPHIGSIYGFEETSGQRFLVLELVEGETLAARIRKGTAAGRPGARHRARDRRSPSIRARHGDHPSRPQAREHRAHGHGPRQGARLRPREGDRNCRGVRRRSIQLNSPTVTSPALMTGMGVILGTAAYMSPEQARGRAADKRSDVWAFGCVLYEMLTGRRPFMGDDVSDTLATVLKSHPAWEALPPSLPPSIRSLLEGCLEKNPHDRISDISTALFVLKHPSLAAAPVRTSPASTRWVTWGALGLAAAATIAAVAIALWPRPAAPAAPVARFAIAMPGSAQLTLSRRSLAVSPDGTRIVFVADGQLYLRSLGDLESRPIPGASRAFIQRSRPTASRSLFWTDPGLRRIPVTGGVPVTVCQTVPAPFGVHWSEHGIVFVQPGAGIMRVSANGGTPEMLVRAARGRTGLRHAIAARRRHPPLYAGPR